MKNLLCILVVLMLYCNSGLTQEIPPPSPAELAEISARGQALAEYDAAAWHATDEFLASNPDHSAVERYLARKTAKGWVVAWGRFNAARTSFLVAYEIQQIEGTKYKVVRHDPPVADNDWYLRAAKALELAVQDLVREVQPSRRYNFSILPAPGGDWYVYGLPAQTEGAVLPYGGDVRYTVSADGARIITRHPMHPAVLEDRLSKLAFAFHTHAAGDVPEDSDVFYASTRNAANGEWIVTRKFIYEITVQGQLRYLGKTDEVMSSLQPGNQETVPVAYRPLVRGAVRRLQFPSMSDPVEAYTALTGSRCNDGAVWLKFSSALVNYTSHSIVVHEDSLRNAGLRFAQTDADLAAGRFEYIVNMAITPGEEDLKDEAFITLGPGMSYTRSNELPILGLDLKGKTAVQLLFFTWPMGAESKKKEASAHWASTGPLVTESILSNITSLDFPPELVETCRKK